MPSYAIIDKTETLPQIIHQVQLKGRINIVMFLHLLVPESMGIDDCLLGYNEFDFFLENKEYRPCDGCKIELISNPLKKL
jgi:hypothetical protein